MLGAWALLLGAVLLALTLAEQPLRRLPLAPAVIYLALGLAAGMLFGTPTSLSESAIESALEEYAGTAAVVTELAVLVSLLAVGLRLRVPTTLRAWTPALLLAGPGMMVTVALGTLVGIWLLQLPWPLALLLAAIMAPTDPVLASEVQIRSETDRDTVRVSLTAEGGLNDGTALPAVTLALGFLGLHTLGTGGVNWLLQDVVWAIGGGLVVGLALGLGVGALLCRRSSSGDPLLRDELLTIGLVMAAFGLAKITATSTFVVAFAAGVTLLLPFRLPGENSTRTGLIAPEGQQLAQRLGDFGARIERVIEAVTVLAVGWALYVVTPSWRALAFGLMLALLVRPLAVFAVLRPRHMLPNQRRMVSWFGIRGIGTLYYLAFALEQGVVGPQAMEIVQAALTAVAVSVVLHGVSATPLMASYQRRRAARRGDQPP